MRYISYDVKPGEPIWHSVCVFRRACSKVGVIVEYSKREKAFVFPEPLWDTFVWSVLWDPTAEKLQEEILMAIEPEHPITAFNTRACGFNRVIAEYDGRSR